MVTGLFAVGNLLVSLDERIQPETGRPGANSLLASSLSTARTLVRIAGVGPIDDLDGQNSVWFRREDHERRFPWIEAKMTEAVSLLDEHALEVITREAGRSSKGSFFDVNDSEVAFRLWLDVLQPHSDSVVRLYGDRVALPLILRWERHGRNAIHFGPAEAPAQQ